MDSYFHVGCCVVCFIIMLFLIINNSCKSNILVGEIDSDHANINLNQLFIN